MAQTFRLTLTAAVSALLLHGPAAHAADILGIAAGDSPGMAAAKLSDYARTAYGEYGMEETTAGRLERARSILREGGNPEMVSLAHHLLERTTIEQGEYAGPDGRPALRYIAANILPGQQAGSVDHERITVVFSGLPSGNVAYKVQRYVVFKPNNGTGVTGSAPIGIPGLSSGFGPEALRGAIVAKLGQPMAEIDVNEPYHEEAQSRGNRVGGATKTSVFQLNADGHGAAMDPKALQRCTDLAEGADLTPGGPALTGEPCPALLVVRLHGGGRGPLVTRMDEIWVDFPRLKPLADADEAGDRRASVGLQAVNAAGVEARRAAIEAQLDAALHGPVPLHF